MTSGTTTKELTILNVDFENPEELTRFTEQQTALYARRKKAIISDLRARGYLDENGNWLLSETLPEDMRADSQADFNH